MRKIYTKHGVALPIMEDGFDSPQTIINAHIQKCQKHGKAYFSTSYATNGKKLKALDSVLLYNVTQGIYYIAKLRLATARKETFRLTLPIFLRSNTLMYQKRLGS